MKNSARTVAVLCALTAALAGCDNNRYEKFGPYIPITTEATTKVPETTAAVEEKNIEMLSSGLANVRDAYPHISGFCNMEGVLTKNSESSFVRVPVTVGDSWHIWYENEVHLSSGGALRLENSEQELVEYINMAKQPKFKVNPDSNVLGIMVTIPDGVSYICVNLKLTTAFDYTQSAIIAKKESTVNWVALGDSLTENNDTADLNWVLRTSGALAIPCTNLGSGGKGYARNGGYSQFFDKIPSNANFITFYGSFNDLGAGVPIGTATDTYTEGAENSLAACMNHAFDYVRQNFPDAKLAVIAPAPWASCDPAETGSAASRYVDVMAEICEARGIPFLDLFRIADLHPWESEQNILYYSNADGVHLNDAGHAIIAEQITAFFRSILE